MLISTKTTLNCRGRLLDLSSPIVMGILNVTPDSFYDGGRYGDMDAILNRAEKMLAEGATIIDIGGMSSRPGAKEVPVDVELSRSIPAVKMLRKRFAEAFISIDTVWAEVARQAVDVGADMVNDISTSSMDDTLIPTVGHLGVPYILMHMQGKPQTMQKNPKYDNVVTDIIDFFIRKTNELRENGIQDIIIDPGFGFGKTVEHNYTILRNMGDFRILDLPILVGLSRKSMIYKVLDTTPDRALNGTTALHMIALQNGAKILRVHDVREAVEVVKLYHQASSI